MKNKFLFTIFLAVTICAHSAPPVQKKTASTSVNDLDKAVVWVGLDYSLVRMVGGDKFEYGFNVPDLIFPGMLEKWNQLFLDERLQGVSASLGRRVSVDIAGVTEQNKSATGNQIILNPSTQDVIDETRITPKAIGEEVQSYKLTNTNGIGLVFIVDSLVYQTIKKSMGMNSIATTHAEGAVYVVFFDISSRQVISIKRKVNSTSSAGNFRNFWFGPIKDADSGLTLPK